MNQFPNAPLANPNEIELSPDRRSLRKAVILLIAFTSLAHLPLLLSDAVLWDSEPLSNAIERGDFDVLYRIFRSSGAPQVYYLHFGIGQLPQFVHAYKLTAFACLVGATVCIFWLCQTARQLGLLEAFAIAALAAVYPFYSVWQEMINVSYATCYFLFLLAACCYSRYASEPAGAKRWLALALPLFVLSFAMQSLLVCFYALMLFFFLRDESGLSVGAVVRFVRHNAVALVLPVAFFLGVRWLFPADGVYETYNKIEISPLYLAKWLVVIPKRLVIDPAKAFEFVGRDPLFSLALAGYACVALLPAWWARKLPSRPLDGRSCAKLLGFAVVLFYLGVFPYAVVGKFPVYGGYGSRHGLLAAVPIAIGLVAVLRYALTRKGLFAAGVGAALVCCLVLETRSYILWQNRYIKYLAVVEDLKQQGDTLAGVVVIEDEADFGMQQPYASYEVNWLTKHAFGNERHMVFDAAAFDEATYRRMDVPVKRAYYMARDFEPGQGASRITIERDSDKSELEIYLDYFSAGSNLSEFLESLVRLSVQPAEVPWPAEPAN